MLAGSKGNRVKMIKLRGEPSMGICIPLIEECSWDEEGGTQLYAHTLEGEYVIEGEVVTELLGVYKHEPPIPVAMAGEVYNGGTSIGVSYDIENSKNYPNVFTEGEEVQATEKLHGSFCQIVVLPPTDEFYNENHGVGLATSGKMAYIAVSSKGLGSKGLFLKQNEKNNNNVYLRVARPLYSTLTSATEQLSDPLVPITVCGEVFGHGVQDLTYGFSQGNVGFRVFDVYVGCRGMGYWLNDEELDEWCAFTCIPRVPLLYRGPFNLEKINELSQNTHSTFDKKQILEGLVVKSTKERLVHNLGRACLKYINIAYYLRKGNATEFN
jgi:RNA ligase (TIGR02306 family)